MRKMKLLLAVMLVAAMAVCLAACKDEPVVESVNTQPVYALSFDKKVVILNVNEADKVVASLYKDGQYCDESVTLSSSNAGIVQISKKGEITAIKEGEADIIATYGDMTATCKVIVVDSGASAYLTFSETSITVKENNTAYATPQVRYNGHTYGSVNCTYEVVEGSGEVTLSSAGSIAGVKCGKVKVKVTGQWGPFDGSTDEKMVAYLDVDVISDVNLTLEEFASEIYKAQTNIGGVEYSNQISVGYTVMHGENDVKGNADYPIVWHYDVENIAQVRNGILYGQNPGEVELYFTCTYNGYTYESNKVKAFVKLPVIDMTEDASIGEIIAEEGQALDGKAIFGRDLAVTQVEASGIIISDKTNPAKLDYSKAVMGTQVLTVYNDEFAYKVNVLVCTKMIRTYEDLLSMRYNTVNTPSIGVDGLYILANDIDCKNATINGGNGWMSNGDGFRGELDGNGYTVKNLSVGSHGIFGTLGRGAYIHDINFDNVTQLGVYRSAILAAGAAGATVTDVKITNLKVQMPEFNQVTGRYTETGLLIARQTNASCVFRNIEIHAEGQTIINLLGYEISDPLPEYADIKVYAKEVISFGSHDQCIAGASDITAAPNGITVIKD